MSDELMIGNPLFVCDDDGHTILTVEGWPGEVAVIGTTGTMGPSQALQLAQALDAKARQVLKDVGVAPARPPIAWSKPKGSVVRVLGHESDLPKDERPIAEQLADAARRIRRLEAAQLVREWAELEGVPGYCSRATETSSTAEAIGKLVQWLREEGS
jgi:hypothetical protein